MPVRMAERFWSKVDQTGECWLWTGAVTGRGYGSLHIGQMTRPAHRYAYELMVGPIPDGLEIDHLCRNRVCVNPAHLEPVTHAENVHRAMVNRDACRLGHPYDEVNTYMTPNGRRNCRICRKAAWERWKERNP